MTLSRLAAILTACLALALPAQAQRISLSDPFDVGRLDREERRTLQAAMALEGSYDALLDGAWGPGSRAALTQATGVRTPTWGDVREVVRRYDTAHARDGWQGVWHGDLSVWHLRPDGLLRREDGPTETRFVSPGGGLVILSRRDATRPDALADAFTEDARVGTAPYRLTRDDRLVLAARMAGGRHVYVRSDRADGVWATHVVLADEANRGRLQLIASSFARVRRGSLDPRDHPLLAALAAGSLPAPTPAPEPEPRRDLRDTLATALEDILRRELLGEDDARDRDAERLEELRRETARLEAERRALEQAREDARRPRAGMGFYVNTTDLVAPSSLLETCDRLRIAGGPELELLATGDRVALLAAPGRSRAWLPLGSANGGEVTLLVARDGEVRDVPGRLRGRGGLGLGVRLETELTAARHAGAPALDRDGRVVAVWAGTDEAAVAPASLVALLDRAGAPYAVRRAPGITTEEAAIRLRCAR